MFVWFYFLNFLSRFVRENYKIISKPQPMDICRIWALNHIKFSPNQKKKHNMKETRTQLIRKQQENWGIRNVCQHFVTNLNALWTKGLLGTRKVFHSFRILFFPFSRFWKVSFEFYLNHWFLLCVCVYVCALNSCQSS